MKCMRCDGEISPSGMGGRPCVCPSPSHPSAKTLRLAPACMTCGGPCGNGQTITIDHTGDLHHPFPWKHAHHETTLRPEHEPVFTPPNDVHKRYLVTCLQCEDTWEADDEPPRCPNCDNEAIIVEEL